MTHKLAALCLVGLSLLAPACVDDLESSPTGATARDQLPDPGLAAPPATSVATPLVPADKVEIDPTGMTTCTNDNSPCSAANPGKCPDADGKYTGACWCTHCEGGGVCEGYDDHQKHDEKCKLKKANTFEVAP